MKALVYPLLLAALTSGCNSSPSKAELDAEVRRLCAIDGGVKVYETVTLPPEMFDKRGGITFYRPDKGEYALGPEYSYRLTDTYYRRGNPEIWKTRTEIVRRKDAKLLSEGTVYVRRGGDIPGPWHESHFTCPDLKHMGVIEQTFLPAQGERK